MSSTGADQQGSTTAKETAVSGASGANQEPVVLINGMDRYTLIRPIGVSIGIPVYEAKYLPEDFANFTARSPAESIVAVQMVHEAIQEQEHDNLLQDMIKNKYTIHRNILRIKRNFTNNHNLCLVFPLNEVASLRRIMISNTTFSAGLPENCIAIALRETLFALLRIQGANQVHKKISAGTVFYHERTSIKLAYGATIYERYDDDEASNSICHWGAAPEVYDAYHNPTSYTAKSDIWLIGILALELAYGGGFKVNGRAEFEFLAEAINVDWILPNKLEELKSDGAINKGKRAMSSIKGKMTMPNPKKLKKEKVLSINEHGGKKESEEKTEVLSLKEHGGEKESEEKTEVLSLKEDGGKKESEEKTEVLSLKEHGGKESEEKTEVLSLKEHGGKESEEKTEMLSLKEHSGKESEEKTEVLSVKEYGGKENEQKIEVLAGVDLRQAKEGKQFSKYFAQMVAECFARNPERRPNVESLLEHKFFEGSKPVKYFENVVIKQSVPPVW